MRISAKTGLLVLTLLSTCAAFRSFAQQPVLPPSLAHLHSPGSNPDNGVKLMDEWMPPMIAGNTIQHNSPEGIVRVRNFVATIPYFTLMKFYGDKCGLNGLDKYKASILGESSSGLSMGAPSAALELANHSETLSSTFVRIYPHYTVTTTLYHVKKSEETLVTVSRIDSPEAPKP
ncbi:MAG: hypothetical protein JWL77_5287 [Chthonomonadaceae bacterium]|nr:hypothetical protein [Chthonomonadaceae bacterium]